MTVTHEPPAVAADHGLLPGLWAEVTANCQLSCVHCYAGSGPDGTHGTMTADDWERVITEAAGLGTRFVCFIGGEPALLPALPRLVRHALRLGMEAEVFTNLVHVSADLWALYGSPGVRLATSWYTSDRTEHQRITGRDTFRQTLANIGEAVQRDIPLRAGLITGLVPGQRSEEGAELLRARGVRDVGTDHLREFGRGTNPDPSQACGSCGRGKAAVLPDGTVTPCPLTRWMTAGNVHDSALGDTLERVTELADTLPARTRKCKPDGACGPNREAAARGGCQPTCVPDSYCNPLCTPGFCKPRV